MEQEKLSWLQKTYQHRWNPDRSIFLKCRYWLLASGVKKETRQWLSDCRIVGNTGALVPMPVTNASFCEKVFT